MKTLVFCTGFALTQLEWEERYANWINRVEDTDLNVDTLLIVDDGSLILPDWPGVDVIAGSLPDDEPASRGVIYHFPDNLGRLSLYNYPGWYRSFMFAATYARKYNYEKVIHIESDSAVISEQLQQYINSFRKGWEALWCPSHRIPETAIQIIAGSSVNKFVELSKESYSKFVNRPADPGIEQGEPWLPYVVNKRFIGDRWGESGMHIPANADYACQISSEQIARWKWKSDL